MYTTLSKNFRRLKVIILLLNQASKQSTLETAVWDKTEKAKRVNDKADSSAHLTSKQIRRIVPKHEKVSLLGQLSRSSVFRSTLYATKQSNFSEELSILWSIFANTRAILAAYCSKDFLIIYMSDDPSKHGVCLTCPHYLMLIRDD